MTLKSIEQIKKEIKKWYEQEEKFNELLGNGKLVPLKGAFDIDVLTALLQQSKDIIEEIDRIKRLYANSIEATVFNVLEEIKSFIIGSKEKNAL